jgi:uncharacterized protein (AIM24 family)
VTDKAYLQHLTRGGELLRADRVPEAKSELEKALALKPGDGKILNLLGLACFRLEDYGRALEIYRDLVVQQPEDASLRLNLGLVFLKTGEVDAAITELGQARSMDPKQARTVGYLGLAYARKGDFAKARAAFVEAGQDDLAREMEQHLLAEDVAASSSPPAAAGAGAGGNGAPVEEIAEISGRHFHEEPPTLPQQEPPAGVVLEPMNVGVVTAAVRAAKPPVPQEAVVSAGEGHEAPITVTEFATQRLIRPDDGNMPFEIAAGGTLIVRVRDRIMSRTDGVIVSGGDPVYETATKRVRGTTTKEPFGAAHRPMFTVTGQGHLVAAPRGARFTALQLVDDIVYLREDLVFAFEEQLRWENGGVPGTRGSLAVVQFRGEGCVALRTRRALLTVKVAPEKILYVDAALLMGWIGRVVPRLVAGAGGDATAPFVECTGEGVVLVDEPIERRETVREAPREERRSAAHKAVDEFPPERHASR